jgi:hypothetical protein
MQHGSYRTSPEKRAALRARARTGDLAAVIQALRLAREALDRGEFRMTVELCNSAADGLTIALDLYAGEFVHVSENLQFEFGRSALIEIRESLNETIRSLELGHDKASRSSMSQTLVLLRDE